MSAPKTSSGNFFEDFSLGQKIPHATPRTVTTGDVALYNGLFGSRFAVQATSKLTEGPTPIFTGKWDGFAFSVLRVP